MFLIMKPNSLVDDYQRFGGTSYLHLLPSPSVQKMEVKVVLVDFSEILVIIFHTTRCHNREDCNRHTTVGVREQDAEENIRTKEEGSNRRLEKNA
jgi:hypothetical protein